MITRRVLEEMAERHVGKFVGGCVICGCDKCRESSTQTYIAGFLAAIWPILVAAREEDDHNPENAWKYSAQDLLEALKS